MFKTLDDLKGKKDQEKKDKKTTNSYAGGESSGLAIENPDDINNIVQKAKNEAQQQQQGGQRVETEIKITLYSNGFTINDGQFREYNQPENQQFMKELNQGQVPRELRNQYPQGLNVGLEDKRSEAYRPPTPPKYVEFSGQGISLGGNQQQQQKANQQVPQPNLQKGQIIVDEKKPATNIKIKLHNGTAVNIRINTDNTVQTLYDYINQIAPVNGTFQLLTSFPVKALDNKKLTIEEADLCQSQITQKI